MVTRKCWPKVDMFAMGGVVLKDQRVIGEIICSSCSSPSSEPRSAGPCPPLVEAGARVGSVATLGIFPDSRTSHLLIICRKSHRTRCQTLHLVYCHTEGIL